MNSSRFDRLAPRLGTGVLFLLCTLLMAVGCEREPLDMECNSLQVGDVVVSEIRGGQSIGDSDTWGNWIELHNPTSAAVPISGITLRLIKLDGSSEKTIWVRDSGLSIAAGGYVVLGRFALDDLPAHVDYGYLDDMSSDLHTDALLQVFSCQQELDRVIYHDLPREGSLAFDGNIPLSAQANDEEANWCADDTPYEPGDGGSTMVGLPGTPGETNRPCN